MRRRGSPNDAARRGCRTAPWSSTPPTTTSSPDELAGFGPEVRVLSPDRLRAPVAQTVSSGLQPIMADRQPPKAQDKLAFLLALVPYLMDRDRVSVTEAAEHFDVPPEQLARRGATHRRVRGCPGRPRPTSTATSFDIAWDDFDDNDQIVLTNMVAIDDSPRILGAGGCGLHRGLQYLSSLPEHARPGDRRPSWRS